MFEMINDVPVQWTGPSKSKNGIITALCRYLLDKENEISLSIEECDDGRVFATVHSANATLFISYTDADASDKLLSGILAFERENGIPYGVIYPTIERCREKVRSD